MSRSIRYGSIMIARTITTPIATPRIARSRIRAPATISIAAAAKHATIAVPRSGSSTTRPEMTATARRNGPISPIERVIFGLVARSCAPYKISASLAISDGWTWKRPAPIQRLAPFTSMPTPGIITATSRKSERAMSGTVSGRRTLAPPEARNFSANRPTIP